MSITGWQPYDAESESYFWTYEGLGFSTVHQSLLPFLPPKGSLCLDIGAGSGRDAAALAKRGYRVIAVEPSRGLRHMAMRHHRLRNIRWIDDHLPLLSKVRELPERYDFILLSAVFMHIRPEHQRDALSTVAALLCKGGRAAITFRSGPEEKRDLFRVDMVTLLRFARGLNLVPVYKSRQDEDLLHRLSVRWQKVVFEKTN